MAPAWQIAIALVTGGALTHWIKLLRQKDRSAWGEVVRLHQLFADERAMNAGTRQQVHVNDVEIKKLRTSNHKLINKISNMQLLNGALQLRIIDLQVEVNELYEIAGKPVKYKNPNRIEGIMLVPDDAGDLEEQAQTNTFPSDNPEEPNGDLG